MQFSLYLHWPFCLKKCPYCDFNSYVFQECNQEEWVQAYIQELEIYKKIFPEHQLKTIFFGGGTPSLIQPKFVKVILDVVYTLWPTAALIETTIEVNPSSVETHQLEEFLKSGINRLSIGVQSFNNQDLAFLGRRHSAEEAKNILQQATQICETVSADFIYTLPYDNLTKWKKDLNYILEFIYKHNIGHISLYQLTIEENTQFFRDIQNNKWIPMNQDMQSILYRHTHKVLNQLAWDQYEISNVARHKSFECQHNLSYWHYEQYLGIGPGAHSRMIRDNQKIAIANFKTPIKWKSLVHEATDHSLRFVESYTALSTKEQTTEKLLMGLRLTNGINLSEIDYQFLNLENLNRLIHYKFIKKQDNQLKLSLKGRLKLNKILEHILK